MLGRVLMIFYALIGIPMNGILLTQLGEFFGQVFVKAHKKYKSYQHDQAVCEKKVKKPLETRRAGLAMQIFMYLIPGFVMFIFFPAFLFSHYEGWTYDEAVYYAFVTLTTIGFGDYVAGQDNTKGSGVFFILYKIFLIFWISFGLGYIAMIMTFIARGMRSKKIARIEHKLAMNFKHTQNKIWNEFNKEVNYLRRVFNELQLSKVKRVYVDEYDYDLPTPKFPRSISFPDLRELIYGGFEIPEPPHPRRRANSEITSMVRVARVVSETDLQRIDKKATFAAHAMVQPAELLARLVNILGYIPPSDDEEESKIKEGVQGFSEKEILASEQPWLNNDWRIGNDKIPFSKPRSRACSEVRLEKPDTSYLQENEEWTWSGPAASRKIQEIMKTRRSGVPIVKDLKSKLPSLALPKSVPKSFLPRWMRSLSVKKSSDACSRSTVSVGEIDDNDRDVLQQQMNQQDSTNFQNRAYFTHTGAGNTGLGGLLEETSLADFLRVLSRVGADDYSRKPPAETGEPPKLPSLFTLFSQQSDLASASQSQQNTITAAHNAASRRYSLRTVDNSSTSTPLYARRSYAQPPVTKTRRFSLRPVVTPPLYSSTYLNDPAGPPPYTNESFNVECPKEPLMQLEGALGISAPIKPHRRFSIRPAYPDNPTIPPAPPALTAQQTRAIPRWRAGMLQRQISKKNLQRRVRAFSLTDVHSDPLDKPTESSSNERKPFNPRTREIPPKFTGRQSFQKSVTIVSPARQALISRLPEHFYKRGYSESEVDSTINYSNKNQDTESTSLFPREDFPKRTSDDFSQSFTIGSDFSDSGAFDTTREGAVNPRFAGLKPYPSYQGVTKLATVYSDDRLSSHDPDKSDSSFTSECVISFKRKSTSDIHEGVNMPSSSLQKRTADRKSHDSGKSESWSESTTSGDLKSSERKISIVSIEPWSDSSRKSSTISQVHSTESPLLSEVRIDDSDQFRTTMDISLDDEGSLMEVTVERPHSGLSFEPRPSTSSSFEPQASTSSEQQSSIHSERRSSASSEPETSTEEAKKSKTARKSCPN
ncbi:open rectifier potassium channel protein 1 isoform X2 [Leptopilina heterotoma]|nr:open rectifier potassium channel protein 1 isoform X2 [Leptopilina heterotoma]